MQLIDTHCHILNFKCVPDSFFRTRAPVREWMLRRRGLRLAVGLLSRLIPGKKYDRLHQALALLKKPLDEVAEEMLGENARAGIMLSAPLMVDLRYGCEGDKAEFPYRYQIAEMERLAARCAGLLMPFLMVDPRRPGVVDLAIECLEEGGFLGVKIYPPLGYHPDPTSVINAPEVGEALERLWTYCEGHDVPITAHCSPQGAYSRDFLRSREVCRACTHPRVWRGVLDAYPRLRVNLAHFGGDFLELDRDDAWSTEIVEMMSLYPRRLYSDVSYHDEALRWRSWRRKRNQETYFRKLNGLLTGGSHPAAQILFGTDWPMTRHTWLQEDYVKPYRAFCTTESLRRISLDNPLEFFFGDGPFPGRLDRFYQRHGVGHDQLPACLQSRLLVPPVAAPPAATPPAATPAGGGS